MEQEVPAPTPRRSPHGRQTSLRVSVQQVTFQLKKKQETAVKRHNEHRPSARPSTTAGASPTAGSASQLPGPVPPARQTHRPAVGTFCPPSCCDKMPQCDCSSLTALVPALVPNSSVVTAPWGRRSFAQSVFRTGTGAPGTAGVCPLDVSHAVSTAARPQARGCLGEAGDALLPGKAPRGRLELPGTRTAASCPAGRLLGGHQRRSGLSQAGRSRAGHWW